MKYLKKRLNLNGWLSMKEAAQYSGLNPRTITRAIQRGEMISEKCQNRWRFKKMWLDKYICYHSIEINDRMLKRLETLQ